MSESLSSPVLTVPEVAQRLRLGERAVRRLLTDGIIPGFKRGVRCWGVFLADFEKWLSEQRGVKA